jgi:hypothetical protein
VALVDQHVLRLGADARLRAIAASSAGRRFARRIRPAIGAASAGRPERMRIASAVVTCRYW